MEFLIRNVWFILFLVWGLPLSIYRSKFRKIVYQTDSWIINIKPVFWKEIKALFGNIFPENKSYIAFILVFISYYLFYTFLLMIITQIKIK